MPLIPVLGRQRQEDLYAFEYIETLLKNKTSKKTVKKKRGREGRGGDKEKEKGLILSLIMFSSALLCLKI